MQQTILEKIKSLPPLDDTVIQIQKICADPEGSLSDLAKIIEKDPMLTANILKAANSPLYGFSREVKNVQQAIALFGMSTVRGFALSSTIRQNIKINLLPYGIENSQFVDITNKQSSLMMNWYSKVDRSMLDVLVPASFLMEVGKIIIAHEAIERGKEADFKNQVAQCNLPSELSKYEKEMFGVDNEYVAAKIFEEWHLEIELVEAIRFSNNPELSPPHTTLYARALMIVKKAINMRNQLTEESINNALVDIRENNLNEESFLKAIDTLKQ